MEFWVLVIRFGLAAMFVPSGAAKLGNLADFEAAVKGYGLLANSWAKAVSRGLPIAELLGGCLLALGLATTETAWFLVALLCTFSVAIGFNLLRGRSIDCGCFPSTGPRQINWWFVLRNVVLAGLAMLLALQAPQIVSLDSVVRAGDAAGISRSDSAGALVTGTILAAAWALLFACLRTYAVAKKLGTTRL